MKIYCKVDNQDLMLMYGEPVSIEFLWKMIKMYDGIFMMDGNMAYDKIDTRCNFCDG
jgi:hypothetical protein